MPKPVPPRQTPIELTEFRRQNTPALTGKADSSLIEEGSTDKGVSVTRHEPNVASLKQGVHLTTPIAKRKISLATWVTSQWNEMIQWLKKKIVYEPSTAMNKLKRASTSFLPHHLATNGNKPSARVNEFHHYKQYPKRLKKFLAEVQKLDKKYGLLTDKGNNIIEKLLKPESTASGTNLNALKVAAANHGITLNALRVSDNSETGLVEMKLIMSDEQLEAFESSQIMKAYQLFLIIEGLHTAVSLRKGELIEDDSRRGKAEKKALDHLTSSLTQMSDLTTGLCHAAMKEEMPELFMDDFYTALSVQDKDGFSHFRSGTVQPRGGWKDRV
ncbi:hypothetical protein [Parendozoicomonas sp. Alg238-R29]|uniref:hypothetical protein n=1 Tax=Parendozoicomonas sp. Alg238-R29 TaxID=2993446 RepID=UPI00248E4A4F|nr:hypothetical protein [Parendozoicomonas sp. Alg238-R29]